MIGELNPPLNYVHVTDSKGLELVKEFLDRTQEFTVDVETNVVDNPFLRKIRTIQIGTKTEQFVIDLLALVGGMTHELIAQQGNFGDNVRSPLLKRLVGILAAPFSDTAKLKIGHNLEFDYATLHWCLGLVIDGMHDTLLAEKSIYAGVVNFNISGFWALDDLVARYCGLRIDKSSQTSFDLYAPLTVTQLEYCALDCRLPFVIKTAQKLTLDKEGLSESSQIEFDAVAPFADMHLHGVLLDGGAWLSLYDAAVRSRVSVVDAMDSIFIPAVGMKGVAGDEWERLAELESLWRDTPGRSVEEKALRAQRRKDFMATRSSINSRVNESRKCEGLALVNYGSPSQLAAALIKAKIVTKAKLPDTNDRTLEKLSTERNLTVDKAFVDGKLKDGISAIDLIRLYRSLDKTIDSYGPSWVTEKGSTSNGGGWVNPTTGRIHSRFMQYGAATGRTSSTQPNVQNLPQDKKYRSCFKARDGYKLITMDYNGCELRILAELSKEPIWIKAFLEGKDVHSLGAELLFGQEWKNGAAEGCDYYKSGQKCSCKSHKELRNKVKAMNFGLAYGMSAPKLADELGIPLAEAEDLLDRYKKAFPTVTKYLEESGRRASTHLEMRTMSGRRRRWLKPTWEIAQKFVLADKKECTNNNVVRKYKSIVASIEREGKNCEIQGTNADMAKVAMYTIWKGASKEWDLHLTNFIHDEIVVEVKEEYAQEALQFCTTQMEAAGQRFIKSIPTPVEGSIADCWTK